MDDNDFQNTRYTVSKLSLNISELYTTARRAPISLTYFHYCLENGNYTITLDFAEIQFTTDETYNSLGRRMFDIYVQVIKHTFENTYFFEVANKDTSIYICIFCSKLIYICNRKNYCGRTSILNQWQGVLKSL